MKTEFQKCMDGEIFDGKDKELAEMTLKTKRLLVKLNSTDYADTKQKEAILREMFGHLGENVHVDIDFRCEYGKNIFVGNKVIINMNCTFVDNNRIEIGNNVLIASNVQIYTATHSTNVQERTMQNWDESKAICNTFALPIKIEDNVWIGGGAIILPGVTIGRNSVIGAGSVVTRSIPADCVAVGNPCRVIKHMDNRTGLKIKRAISRPRVAPILSLFKLQIIQQQQQSQLQQSQQQQYQLLLLQLLLQQQRYQ